MSTRHIIGITGKARAGKDTMANCLMNSFISKDTNENKAIKLSFADPLYDIADLFGFGSKAHSDKWKPVVNEVWGITGREFLQKIGTDIFRNHFREDTWLKHMAMRLDQVMAESQNCNILVVIPDVRFDNEAELIRSRGGKVLEVVRPGSPIALQGNQALHASEKGIKQDLVDITYYNIEDKGDLMHKFANSFIEVLP